MLRSPPNHGNRKIGDTRFPPNRSSQAFLRKSERGRYRKMHDEIVRCSIWSNSSSYIAPQL